MAMSITNPTVPSVHQIPGGVFPGWMLRVQGSTPPAAQRFVINLQCGPSMDLSHDIALQITFKFPERCVTRNHLNCATSEWGREETGGGMPLVQGQPFEVLVLCDPENFKLALNGAHFCDFRHRLPFQRVSFISIQGDVRIQYIGFESNAPPMGVPPPAYGPPPPVYGPPPPGYGPPMGPPPVYGPPPGAPVQQQQQPGMLGRLGAMAGAGALGGFAGTALGHLMGRPPDGGHPPQATPSPGQHPGQEVPGQTGPIPGQVPPDPTPNEGLSIPGTVPQPEQSVTSPEYEDYSY